MRRGNKTRVTVGCLQTCKDRALEKKNNNWFNKIFPLNTILNHSLT